VTTSFENGAIPNILTDIAPILVQGGWSLQVLTLEAVPENNASVQKWRALGLPLEGLNRGSRETWQVLGPLSSAIVRLKPDLIHSHLGRADVYTAMVKGAIPQISTFHSVRRNANKVTQWGWRLTDRRVAHRTGVSQACLDSFYPQMLRSPHSVIYNPVNPKRLTLQQTPAQFKAELGWMPEVRLIVAVGRLLLVKGHAQLIDAFALIASEQLDVNLVIVGDGPLRSELQTKVNTLELSDRVRLLPGNTPVATVYTAADVLSFPSLWEGLGLVPIEAMLCGCPVASSRIPAVSEFMDEGQTGLFFDPENAVDQARVLLEVLANPVVANQRAERASQMARERFSPELIGNQYLKLYNNILREGHDE